METKLNQCKYFLHGACSKGTQCQFLHELNAKKDNICKFHMSGSCSYGKRCRYDHVKGNKQRVIPPPSVRAIQDTGNIVTLKTETRSDVKAVETNNNWAEAAEFVPGRKEHKEPATHFHKNAVVTPRLTYSNVLSLNLDEYHTATIELEENRPSYVGDERNLLCPFAALRECPFGDSCEYLHGEKCDLCGLEVLHPTDESLRKAHVEECIAYHEKEMEEAFAAKKSMGVTCSICMEIVMEKSDITQRVFGLLEGCNHAFCLTCIRNWRSSCTVEKTVVRTCPLCRVTSWYVVPSDYWVDDPVEKKSIIDRYKDYLSAKQCRNFDQGRGNCSFGTSCFYKHAYPDGTLACRKPEVRYRENADGISSAVAAPRLNEFIDARDVEGS